VVLRLDSPGGSALASDLLWKQLMTLRERKPLVISVGGMAASGGQPQLQGNGLCDTGWSFPSA